MFKIVTLFGKAGSGKDSIMRGVIESLPMINEIISHTTRPPRDKEKHGVNYYFCSGEEFGARVLNNEMIECTTFNDWFYGTSYEALRSNCFNIGVFNPNGIRALYEHPDIELKNFYIDASDKTRLLRQLNREKNPDVNEVIRRYKADREDFDDLEFSYEVLKNETFEDKQKAIAYVVNWIKSQGKIG